MKSGITSASSYEPGRPRSLSWVAASMKTDLTLLPTGSIVTTQITDEHIATFSSESTWDGLADALREKYEGIATRIVLYNALGDHERFERYGAVAQCISNLRP